MPNTLALIIADSISTLRNTFVFLIYIYTLSKTSVIQLSGKQYETVLPEHQI